MDQKDLDLNETLKPLDWFGLIITVITREDNFLFPFSFFLFCNLLQIKSPECINVSEGGKAQLCTCQQKTVV